MYSKGTVGFVAATLFAAFGLSPLTPPPLLAEESPGNAPPPVELRGVVVDEDGRPAGGVIVREGDAEVETNERGEFSIPWRRAERYIFVVATTADGERMAVHQEFVAAPEPPPVRLQLAPSRRLDVEVIDADGRPVPGTAIVARQLSRQVAAATSDARGGASLRVPSQQPRLTIFALKNDAGIDYQSLNFDEDTTSAEADAAESEIITLTLAGARRVRVRAVDDEGEPLAGILVYAPMISLKGRPMIGGGGLEQARVKTNADGVAEFGWAPVDAQSRIVFSAYSDLYHAPHSQLVITRADDEAVVRMVPKVRLAGRLTFGDGRPAQGLKVVARGEAVGSDRSVISSISNAYSDGNGRFEFRVAVGFLYLFTVVDEEWSSDGRTEAIESIENPPSLDFSIRKAVRVHGVVTAGEEKRPLAGHSVTLWQYGEETRFSGSTIKPQHVRSATSDERGRFSFSVGAGNFLLGGVPYSENQSFVIADGDQDIERDIHLSREPHVPVSGRVVHKDRPDSGVAGASVGGISTEETKEGFKARTNAEGRFEAERPHEAMLAVAHYGPMSLGGFALLTRDQEEVVILVEPTGKVRGTLADETGAPLPGQQVYYGMRTDHDEGWSVHFSGGFGGNVVTAEDGSFEISDLLAGATYSLQVLMRDEGGGIADRPLKSILIKSGQDTDLGEFRLARP